MGKNLTSNYVYPILSLLFLGLWLALTWLNTPEFIGKAGASAFIIAVVIFLRFAEGKPQGGMVHP